MVKIPGSYQQHPAYSELRVLMRQGLTEKTCSACEWLRQVSAIQDEADKAATGHDRIDVEARVLCARLRTLLESVPMPEGQPLSARTRRVLFGLDPELSDGLDERRRAIIDLKLEHMSESTLKRRELELVAALMECLGIHLAAPPLGRRGEQHAPLGVLPRGTRPTQRPIWADRGQVAAPKPLSERALAVGLPDARPRLGGIVIPGDATGLVPVDGAAAGQLSSTARQGLQRLMIAAAILLFADSFEDGAWSRTLWHHGGRRFSDDIGDPAAIQASREKKAISVSSWAGLALRKVFDADIDPLLSPTVEYMMRFRDETTGSFGFVHPGVSSTPLIRPTPQFIPNPRHTASAIKLLYQLARHPRVIGRGIHFLVGSQTEPGSWSESVKDETGNTLTTAYVLDALLLFAQVDLAFLEDVLDRDEYSFVVRNYERAVYSGLDWLARQQGDDGSWGYRAVDEFPELRPYYTAHIVCFLPQLLTTYDSVRVDVANYIRTQIQRGGMPEADGGEPAIAPTAMMVYGLYRTGDPAVRDLVNGGLQFLAGVADRPVPAMNVFESAFTLLLGQYEEFCETGWQNEPLRAIRAHAALRTAPDVTCEKLVERTLALCNAPVTPSTLTRVLTGTV